MLRRSGVQAIRALLELAQAPEHWRSVHQLAMAQNLPEPTLEQLLLRLRRAGLVQARRGRHGGYRLAADPSAIAVAAILAAAERAASGAPAAAGAVPITPVGAAPGDRRAGSWHANGPDEEHGIEADTNNQNTSHDCGNSDAGHAELQGNPLKGNTTSDAEELRLQAGRRVTQVLERRLRQAIERELTRLTLADLVFDLQSAQASLSDDGGLLLG